MWTIEQSFVTQETRVLKLEAERALQLQRQLEDELPPNTEWRSVPHARFSIKWQGLVVTCYKSGKLVLQGRNVQIFIDRFLADAAAPEQSAVAATETAETDADSGIGSDEAGKGDYFGPLVVAAAYARDDQIRRLLELGVTDSKRLTDNRVRTLAGVVEAELDTRTVSLRPAEYNKVYEEHRNLNMLLADLHVRALTPLIERHGRNVVVIVDKFASEKLLSSRLSAQQAMPENLICIPRAEARPVVAAASILARAGFLDGLAACEEASGCALHKGAGAPVDVAARKVYQVGGDVLLASVAKMHFKNTQRARG